MAQVINSIENGAMASKQTSRNPQAPYFHEVSSRAAAYVVIKLQFEAKDFMTLAPVTKEL